jgi:uncharacterized phage protein gp47/JayE
MSYGLTLAGFVIKPLTQIVAELEAAYQGLFGAGIPLDANSLFGQMIGVHSEREAFLWELAQAVYLAMYPDSATGSSLAAVATLTGQIALNATFSSVTLTLTGTPGTIIPAGWLGGLAGTAFQFATIGDVTIGGGGTIDVSAICTVTGLVATPIGSVTVIVNPIAGLASVTNATAGLNGRAVEGDAALRVRRALDLVTARAGQADATRQAVEQIAGLTFVSVVQNQFDYFDLAARPPHSLEVTVTGGSDHDVAYAIWATKGGGINTWGTTSYTIVDSAGNFQVVNFTRSVPVAVYVSVKVTRSALYPANGDAAVAAAILAYGATLLTGQSVTDYPMQIALFGISGIDNAVITFGLAPLPTNSTNLLMTSSQIATFDASRIVVL